MIIEAILLRMQSEKSSDSDAMVENDSAIQIFYHWQNVRDFAVVQQNSQSRVQYSIFPFILVHSSSFF